MGKLIIVSNRLPFTYKKVDGELTFTRGGGGLATALASYTTGTKKSLWIGWPGLPSEELDESDKEQITRELADHNCFPVFLTRKQIDQFYNGYSNSVLWPLFHDMDIVDGNTKENWSAYKEVNKLYADTVLSMSASKDTVWVHDYQLMLLPELIRIKRALSTIGFFLHIPFPSAKNLATIDSASPLIKGMLGADLVGFHTPSYTNNFLKACTEQNIGRVGTDKIALPTRVVRATEFPIGIDYDSFAKATKTREVAVEYKKLQLRYHGKKVILMSDRMDPSKGLVERLKAYQTLLKNSPELHGKVVLSMIAIPSRGDIEVYKQLRKEIESLVDAINKEFKTARWKPIEAVYDNLPFAKYAALYRRADIAFIAPIRDGMNLVAKEFLASATKHDGVLVLSETAGAAEELKDAVMVNPKRPKTLVEGLSKAITMPRSELRRRTANMQRHIKHFNVDRWVDSFITTLEKPITAKPFVHRTYTFTTRHQDALLAQYHIARKRLLLFDYDGTLAPIVKNPDDAKPTSKLLRLLERLADDEHNDLVIVSGRSRDDLQQWLGELPIALAAEHGALFRRKGGKNWHKTLAKTENWKDEIGELFDYYAEATPGAHVETKEWAIVWHYRNASPFYAQKHLVILKRLLRPLAKTYGLTIKEGKKILEVHPAEMHKGRVSQEWLIHDHDFVLTIGDDTTDEDMFAAVPPDAWSIKVGSGLTKANYRLKDVPAVHSLLRKL